MSGWVKRMWADVAVVIVVVTQLAQQLCGVSPGEFHVHD